VSQRSQSGRDEPDGPSVPEIRARAYVGGSPAAVAEEVLVPAFDSDEFLRKYLRRDHAGLTQTLFDALAYFANTTFVANSPELQTHIDTFVETVLYVITKPDYQIPGEWAERIVCMQHVFANLVSLSRFRTTDPQLAVIERHPGNFIKLLFLYSPYNAVRIDPKLLFDGNARLASLWYAVYPRCSSGYASARTWENVRAHVACVDRRLEPVGPQILDLYFGCTHIDPDSERRLKAHWNAGIRRMIVRNLGLVNRPARDSVAVVTARWLPRSSVYKTCCPYIRALKETYRLTLVHLGQQLDNVDQSLFDEVKRVYVENNQLNCSEIAETDFQMAYFPDIGMDFETVWMSNLRLAPIQMTGYGHPSTTGGSEIDYFLGGQDCEDPALAGQNYAERLVLIPGIGLHSTYPDYQPRCSGGAAQEVVIRLREDVVVNLPWSFNKINYGLLTWVKKIQQRASRPIRLQFMPGFSLNRFNAILPFLRDIRDLFGESASVFLNRPYEDFMRIMEDGDFSLDSHPFGGYNMVIDSVFLGKPMVTFEGTRIYNRCSSALMRKIGMEELIARDEEAYIAKAVRLVDDEDYRASLSERLCRTDLRKMVFDTDEPQYFRKAVDYLIENHEALQSSGSRAPIIIR
jgi:hypothetical protein